MPAVEGIQGESAGVKEQLFPGQTALFVERDREITRTEDNGSQAQSPIDSMIEDIHSRVSTNSTPRGLLFIYSHVVAACKLFSH